MSDPGAPEELSAAERALELHLGLLRSDVPVVPATLDHRIIRRARWQRTLRRPLLTIGHFAAAVGDGLRLLILPTHRR